MPLDHLWATQSVVDNQLTVRLGKLFQLVGCQFSVDSRHHFKDVNLFELPVEVTADVTHRLHWIRELSQHGAVFRQAFIAALPGLVWTGEILQGAEDVLVFVPILQQGQLQHQHHVQGRPVLVRHM